MEEPAEEITAPEETALVEEPAAEETTEVASEELTTETTEEPAEETSAPEEIALIEEPAAEETTEVAAEESTTETAEEPVEETTAPEETAVVEEPATEQTTEEVATEKLTTETAEEPAVEPVAPEETAVVEPPTETTITEEPQPEERLAAEDQPEAPIETEEAVEEKISAEPAPAVPGPGMNLKFKNVLFGFDKSVLPPAAYDDLKRLVSKLKEFANTKVEVNGHTDHIDPDSYNDRLSVRRANAVASYLKSNGISSDRIIINGFGESKPIAPNTHPDGTDNPNGRIKNRRTEIKFISGRQVS